MKNLLNASTLVVAIIAIANSSNLSAQELPKFPGPVKEHEFLHQFVGEWESEMESEMGPGQPAMKCKGTMTSRMLGGFWVISESKTDMMGQTMNGIQTIGYDPAKKKYVGTWVDSMLNLMWQYEGSVDSTGKTLTLEAEGPNFMAEGKTTKFRDAYEFKSKDHIVATSSMLADGKWITFMNGNIRRKK
jgi:hypothetical protein